MAIDSNIYALVSGETLRIVSLIRCKKYPDLGGDRL